MDMRTYKMQDGDIFTYTFYQNECYFDFKKTPVGTRLSYYIRFWILDNFGDFIIIEKLYIGSIFKFWKRKKVLKIIYNPLDKR